MDKKNLIKRFTQEGYTLRPECLNHLTKYFSELKIQNNLSDVVNTHMDKIIENGDIILGEQTVKGAIELLLRPSQASNQFMEIEENSFQKQSEENTVNDETKEKVNDIINQKFHNTIVVLDTMKETPRLNVYGNKVSSEFITYSYTAEDKKKMVTLGVAQDKVGVYKSRFDLIKAKLSKSGKYSFGFEKNQKRKNNNLENKNSKNVIEISDIGSLIGSKGNEMYVLGMIYEGNAREYYIQDEISRVKMDLTNSKIESGYITVSSIVIAQGVYDQTKSAFSVSEFFLPENEEDATVTSTSLYKKEAGDFFGAKAKISRILGKLIQLEIESAALGKNGNRSTNLTRFQRERQSELGIFDLDLNPYFQIQHKKEYFICLFSDFSLNDRSTLKKFENILSVYEKDFKPLVFILMGSFFNTSEIISETVNDQIKEALSDFQALLNKFRSLRDNCYWIIIPHVHDIGGAPIQPKCELPEELFAEIKSQVPFFKLAQNPCRLSILGKTFLIQRNDLLRELRKKQIVINPHKDIQLNYVQTIISQRHLCPLPLISKPIVWNFDHALQFYENPDFLVLADSYIEQFDFAIEDMIISPTEQQIANSFDQQQQQQQEKKIVKKCFLINPGSFLKKSTFTLIQPLIGEIQHSSC